jgi:hypothetical protein
MKLARLVWFAFAVTMIAGWATWSFACDKDKATAASAAHAAGACTAEMAAHCTPEMAAACKAKMAAAAAAGCPGMKATAVTAAAIGTGDMKVAAAAAAGHDACCAGKASAASARSASACATKGAAVTAANGSCTSKGASAAAGHCSGHGMGAMAAASGHDDCEACLDMSDCSEALDAAGAHRQAVRLKNGVMYVYTADTQRDVSAVQAAVARRADHMAHLVSAGDKVRLCSECKSIRGAMASGKLTREVVNIEGGSLTLITSTDPVMVAKLHAMTDVKVAARTKS